MSVTHRAASRGKRAKTKMLQGSSDFTRPTMSLTGQQHAQALTMRFGKLESPSSGLRHIGTPMTNGVYFCEAE